MVKLSLGPGAALGIGGIAVIGILLFVFRDKISEFFSNITGGVEGASQIGKTVGILNENLQGNLTGIQDILSGKIFEDIQLPTLPDSNFFSDFFSGITDFFKPQQPLTEAEQFDFSSLQGGVSPEPTGIPAEPFRDAAIFAADFPEPFVPIAPTPEPIFVPPTTLPTGFTGAGPSFEGGTIRPISDESCQTLSCVIDRNPGISASQAADRLAEIQGTLGDFNFGTNTGSGFGPGDDPIISSLVTGGATLKSEEQRAACLTCEMFGLNCGICSGTI